MNLFHRGKTVGTVSDVKKTGFEYSAEISLLPIFEQYKPMFEFFDDENNNPDENLPFTEEWLEGWSMDNNEGTVQDISFPAFYKNYSVISWRWG
jgi:hypothetical protein